MTTRRRWAMGLVFLAWGLAWLVNVGGFLARVIADVVLDRESDAYLAVDGAFRAYVFVAFGVLGVLHLIVICTGYFEGRRS
jgi:hypothetical protein